MENEYSFDRGNVLQVSYVKRILPKYHLVLGKVAPAKQKKISYNI